MRLKIISDLHSVAKKFDVILTEEEKALHKSLILFFKCLEVRMEVVLMPHELS